MNTNGGSSGRVLSHWLRRLAGWLCLLGLFAGPLSVLAGSVPAARIVRAGHYHLYTDRDGLGVGEIRSMSETPDGRIWVGGENGLQEFDGFKFRGLPPKTALPLLKTYANVNWLSREGRLLYFAWGDLALRLNLDTGELRQAGPAGWGQPDTEQGLTNITYWCEAGGRVWAVTQAGSSPDPVLRYFDKASGLLRRLPVHAESGTTQVTDLACSHDRAVWIEWGLPNTLRTLTLSDSPPDPAGPDYRLTKHGLDTLNVINNAAFKSKLAMLDHNTVAVAHEQGVAKINIDAGTVTSPVWPGSSSARIMRLYTEDGPDTDERRLWGIAQSNELLALQPDTLEVIERIDINQLPRSRQIDSPLISYARHTRVGAVDLLWIGRGDSLTLSRVGALPVASSTIESADREIASPNIRTLCGTPDHALWMVDMQRNLLVVPDGTKLPATGTGSMAHVTTDKMALRIACGPDGRVWGVRNSQVLVEGHLGADGKPVLGEFPLPVKIHGLGGVFAISGEDVWIRTESTVLRVDSATHQVRQSFVLPAKVAPRVVRLESVGGRPTLFVLGTDSSLHAIDLQTQHAVALQLPDSVTREKPLFDIQSRGPGQWLLLARNGRLFSLSGLDKLGAAGDSVRVDATPVPATADDPTPDPTAAASKRQFYCMQIGADQSAWLSSTNGLVRVAPDLQSKRVMGPALGVLWNDFNASACGRDADEHLLFGAIDGWAVVAPGRVQALPLAARPTIMDYRIGLDEPVRAQPDLPAIEMDEASHLLRLTVGLPGRLAAEQTRFSFRMDGFDTDWRPPQESVDIEFAGLGAGERLLRVRAAHEGGPWGEELRIPVKVTPPWYRSPLALGAYALMLLGAAALALQRQRRSLEERLGYLGRIEASEQRLSLALWASGDAMWDHDFDSGRFYRTHMPWLGANNAALDDTPESFLPLVHPDDLPDVLRSWEEMANGTITERQCEYRMRSDDGRWVWISDHGRMVSETRDGRAVRRASGTMRDVTGTRQAQEDLNFLALHDPLTGLANRRAYLQRIKALVEHVPEAAFSLLFIDVDHFKHVNDSLGHSFGDRVLIEIADKLRDILAHQADTALLCRLGGDEFAVICPGLDGAAAEKLARVLVARLAEAFVFDGIELAITASIGVASHPEHADEETSLQKAADIAMHQAKGAGRNCVRVFDQANLKGIVERLHIETAMRLALPRGEFELVYQPKQALATGRCTSAEALLRWKHPRWGRHDLETVIGILESSDLIHRVGLWVIEQAIRQLLALRAAGLALPSIAVNVSAVQLLQATFVQDVAVLMHRAQLQPGELELEITESVLLSEDLVVLQRLQALKGIGVALAIDDFGKGYSSLGRLRQMNVDVLKIDRVFIDAIDRDPEDRRFCQSLIVMMRELGLCVVAEGVERETQWHALHEMGCDVVQGYFYARPMRGPDLVEWLRAQDQSAPSVPASPSRPISPSSSA